MTYIDSAILHVTEWLCRKFQRLTGQTNVWLALQLTNLSIIVYFVWAGVIFWSINWPSRVLLALFCGGLLYVLAQTVFKESIEWAEASAYRRVAQGYMNPRRLRDAPLRISFLTLSIVFSYPIVLVYQYQHLPIVYLHVQIHLALLTYSLIVLTTVVLYLLACDPLPPCVGRVREWLQSLARSSASSEVETPAAGADKLRRLPRTACDGARRGRPGDRGRARHAARLFTADRLRAHRRPRS